MTTNVDNILLENYWNGWQDKLPVPTGYDTKIAYEIGKADFWAGDDVKSIDLQTEEQIIEKIKSYL